MDVGQVHPAKPVPIRHTMVERSGGNDWGLAGCIPYLWSGPAPSRAVSHDAGMRRRCALDRPDMMSLHGTPTVAVLRRIWQRPATAMAGAAVLALLFQVSCVDLSRGALDRDELREGDSYTWLALVESWDRTGEWTPFVYAHNAPNGLETHLTRPFAAVVIGLSQVLAPWRDRGQALREAGKLSGPLLCAATAVVMAWGTRVLIGTGGALLAVCAYLTMLLTPSRFDIHAFDHHSLHLFLAALTFALLIRGGCRGRGGHWACLAGGVAGLGVWSGVEMLVPALGGGLALGIAWIVWGGQSRARHLFLYVLCMTLVLGTVLIFEDPNHLGLLILDRLSGAHLLMGGLLAAGTAGTAWMQRRCPDVGIIGRAAAGAVMSGGVALVLWAAVPHFFLGPYGHVDPFIVKEFYKWSSGGLGALASLAASPGFLGYHIALLIPVAIRLGIGLREAEHQDAWSLLAVGLVVGAAAAFYQYRLAQYYELFAAIVLGAAVAGAGRLVWNGVRPSLRVAAVPAMALTLSFPYGGLFAGIAATGYAVNPTYFDLAWQDDGCDWASLGKALAGLPRQGGSNLVTYTAPGPELAWFSGRGAVATGCHRNVEGMRDARAVLLSAPAAAREVAESRGVEFVIQCPAVQGWRGHDWHLERSGPEGLYARLTRGEPPDWLARLPASELDVEGFVVWRTTFAAAPAPRGGPVA